MLTGKDRSEEFPLRGARIEDSPFVKDQSEDAPYGAVKRAAVS